MEDFFDKIQNIAGVTKYSSSEVVTPKNIVSDMIDLIEEEDSNIFNPDATFFDPAVKSGRFLVEIHNRLMKSQLMIEAFPNSEDRHTHIIHNQLFGAATSPLAAAVVRKTLYDDSTITGNIIYLGSSKITDANSVKGAFNKMKFNVVIGNPPYNRGGTLIL